MGWVTFALSQALCTSVALGAMKRQGLIQVNSANIKNDTLRYCLVKMVDIGEDICIFSEKLAVGIQEEYDKAKKDRK